MKLVTSPMQSLVVHVKLILCPNCSVLTQNGAFDSTQLSLCLHSPCINIQYPVNCGLDQIVDSTVQPLYGSGKIVKIPIWYIPTYDTGVGEQAPPLRSPVVDLERTRPVGDFPWLG